MVSSAKKQRILSLVYLGLLVLDEKPRKKKKWVKKWILRKQSQGAFPNLCQELEYEEPSDYQNYARLFPEQFHRLTELVDPLLRRRNTNYRDCISVPERLMVTLRFLATGKRLFLCCAFMSVLTRSVN